MTVCFLGLDGPGTSATVGSLLLTAADFPSLLWMVHPLFLLAVGLIVAAVQSESAVSTKLASTLPGPHLQQGSLSFKFPASTWDSLLVSHPKHRVASQKLQSDSTVSSSNPSPHRFDAACQQLP